MLPTTVRRLRRSTRMVVPYRAGMHPFEMPWALTFYESLSGRGHGNNHQRELMMRFSSTNLEPFEAGDV